MSFEYQQAGAAFLANGGVLLADAAGAGKTRQALLAAKLMNARTILVVCPAIAVGVWISEAAKWAPHLTALTVKDAAKGGSVPRTNRLLVTSYDLLVNVKSGPPLVEKLRRIGCDLLICDEGHYLKNPTAKRTQVVYGPGCAGGVASLVGAAKRTIVLTATPQLNHAGEWFPHLRCLAPDRIAQSSYWAFEDYYCLKEVRTIKTFDRKTRKTANRQIEVVAGTNRERAPELAHRLRGFWLRRPESEILGSLPPLRVETRRLPIEFLDRKVLREAEDSEEAAALQEALAKGDPEALRHLEGHLARLRRLLAMAKVRAVVEWTIGALDAGEMKVACWGWHVEALETIHAELAKHDAVNPVILTGRVSARSKREAQDRFQNDPKCRAGVFQIQAAGTAWTATSCRRALFSEQAWTPSLNYQAVKRHHRIGTTNPVLAEVLVAPGLDELVGQILARKIVDISAVEDEAA